VWLSLLVYTVVSVRVCSYVVMFVLLRTMNENKCGSASLYVQSSVRVAIIFVPVCSPVVTFTLLRVVNEKKCGSVSLNVQWRTVAVQQRQFAAQKRVE
jgi:hypothetical protein